MKNIIGESYYHLKYIARNKLREQYNDPIWLYSHYAGHPFWDTDTLNHRVAEAITSGKPFMMGRFGAVELFNMRTAEFHHNSNLEKACAQLYTNAGFFPKDPALLPRFNDLMKEACAQLDVLGIWQNSCEDYYIRKYCSNLIATTKLISLEPWRNDFPWSSALAGKKVLVVHPFEDSIREQYLHYDKLFANPAMLPRFELLTLKAVQTSGNASDSRFSDWFDALQWMCDECDKLDFDIALLGCGAYGFPLAAHIKQTGRQAIHLGGCLQILFGLRGKRWDEMEPDIVAMYNDYWHYPKTTEIPSGSDAIEGGTYWK